MYLKFRRFRKYKYKIEIPKEKKKKIQQQQQKKMREIIYNFRLYKNRPQSKEFIILQIQNIS